ncbi:hypothetical protein QNH97_01260 [Pseudomonas sp. G2-4]|nr:MULTISPECIES: hypothetical protein [Pseudomonas]WHS60696.1 hypothetical protein QNH97_01260 [Pseudomonas sp. G2-4]
MSTAFDMELFLSGVLTGSHTTRQRHLRQAKVIQDAISTRWRRNNPWSWHQKHLVWFLTHHLDQKSESTRYYYFLTARLICQRLGNRWPQTSLKM